ncbi:hypothetical protein J3R30DRAFT_2694013 [Lentinula aciculospora]|uniref:C3H1-type domain-containing protein n=1 Tax=Lentinula aciculospora TaxID=153920 RepID=A0A9W9DP83_9AGAR|nr:hypothetical protein J3R30DRAFT_2694013 [Lentinula aciculospora]
MRSHRTLIPFIALALVLAVNAAPVPDPLAFRESAIHTLLSRRTSSSSPELLETHQLSSNMGSDVDSQVRRRNVEPRARKKNKNKRKRKGRKSKGRKGNVEVSNAEGKEEVVPSVTAANSSGTIQPENGANGTASTHNSTSGAEKKLNTASKDTFFGSDSSSGSRRNSLSSTYSHGSSDSGDSSDSESSVCSSCSQNTLDYQDHGNWGNPIQNEPPPAAGDKQKKKDNENGDDNPKGASKEKMKKYTKYALGGVLGIGGVAGTIVAVKEYEKSADEASKAFSSAASTATGSGEESSAFGDQFSEVRRFLLTILILFTNLVSRSDRSTIPLSLALSACTYLDFLNIYMYVCISTCAMIQERSAEDTHLYFYLPRWRLHNYNDLSSYFDYGTFESSESDIPANSSSVLLVQVVCSYFLRGQCRFGDKCRNEHPQSASA